MMKKGIWTLGVLLALAGCAKEDVNIDCTGLAPSYANDVKPIVDLACAVTGCHVSNFSAGDYTSHGDLAKDAKNGRITRHVVVKKDMPRANSFGPSSLTQGQIDTIYCWVESGAPNN